MKAARDKAAEGRALLAARVNPLDKWSKPDEEEVPTFGAAADEYHATHLGSFRNDKHKAQWAMKLAFCCDSGRVHPNPLFQQAYAFTRRRTAHR